MDPYGIASIEPSKIDKNPTLAYAGMSKAALPPTLPKPLCANSQKAKLLTIKMTTKLKTTIANITKTKHFTDKPNRDPTTTHY